MQDCKHLPHQTTNHDSFTCARVGSRKPISTALCQEDSFNWLRRSMTAMTATSRIWGTQPGEAESFPVCWKYAFAMTEAHGHGLSFGTAKKFFFSKEI